MRRYQLLVLGLWLFLLPRQACADDKKPPPLLRVEGTLTEARCYFMTGAVGGKHEYCAFVSMKANLPVGVLTAKGEFVYLVVTPSRLANWATRPVRVEGEALPGGRMLKPVKMWVQTKKGWEAIPDKALSP